MPKGNPNPQTFQLAEPETAAVTHGVHRWLGGRALAPPCDKCLVKDECEAFREGGTCRLAEEYRDSIVQELMALQHIEETDRPLIKEYASLAVALSIVDFWVSRVGPFRAHKGGVLDVQPVLKFRQSISNSMRRMAAELGLSPASRHKLQTNNIGGLGNIARAIISLDSEGDNDE